MQPYSTVIAHWNGARMLSDALRSLHAQTYPPAEIIVVDNGSRDASRALVREVFPDVTLLANTENLGFATANNQGISHALRDPKITALLTMNNDVVADARLGELLMTVLEQNPHIGGVQAKMRFPGTPARIFSAGGFIADDNFRMVNRGYGEADTGQFDAPEEIFAPCAGTALYRRAFLEDTVLADGAFFDPAYFAYLEDVDLACRGHLRGWRFLYEPRAIVCHHEAATSRRLPAAAKEYLSRRNRLWTVVKTLPPGLCAKVLLRYALPARRGVVFALRDPRAPALSADIRATIRALVDTAWTLPSLLRARKRIQARAKSPEALAAWFQAPRTIHRHEGPGGAPRRAAAMTASRALGVVVPTWNGRMVIAACLQSVRELRPTDVTVVDNASTDGTVKVVRREAPWSRIIEHAENRGFAAACNRGIRESNTPYVLLLNQDARVIPDGIAALLMCLEQHPEAAAAGGRIENPDGTLQPSMGPEPYPLRAALDQIPGFRSLLPSHVHRHPHAYAFPKKPAWLTGACLLIRRAAFDDVGPFDEEYFMYTEDLDWCARARKKRWTIQYLPVRTAVHADEGRRPDRARAKAAWMREGLQRYFDAHGTPGQAWIFRAFLSIERTAQRVIPREPRDASPLDKLGAQNDRAT